MKSFRRMWLVVGMVFAVPAVMAEQSNSADLSSMPIAKVFIELIDDAANERDSVVNALERVFAERGLRAQVLAERPAHIGDQYIYVGAGLALVNGRYSGFITVRSHEVVLMADQRFPYGDATLSCGANGVSRDRGWTLREFYNFRESEQAELRADIVRRIADRAAKAAVADRECLGSRQAGASVENQRLRIPHPEDFEAPVHDELVVVTVRPMSVNIADIVSEAGIPVYEERDRDLSSFPSLQAHVEGLGMIRRDDPDFRSASNIVFPAIYISHIGWSRATETTIRADVWRSEKVMIGDKDFATAVRRAEEWIENRVRKMVADPEIRRLLVPSKDDESEDAFTP